MSRQANPSLIGIFVIGAIALATTTILLLGGGEWFIESRQHIVYFEGEAQGLQIGAPVMLLGVKIGTVKKIQLGLDEKTGQLFVPVIVEIEPQVVLTRTGAKVDLRQPDTMHDLIQRGLRARLRMQSFLTGQLYVDLDFHPERPARYVGLDVDISEIPAIPTVTKSLAASLEDFPMDKFLADVSAIGASVKAILSTRAAQNLPDQLAATLQHLESLAAKLDARGDPVLNELQADLVELRTTLLAAQAAMTRLEGAAGKFGDLVSADPQALKNLSAASAELAGAAQKVSDLAHEDSPTLQNLDSALKEISRAAQALRMLAETLEQQPEAVLRGKHRQEQH
jgi:paraquat-inducible protein B